MERKLQNIYSLTTKLNALLEKHYMSQSNSGINVSKQHNGQKRKINCYGNCSNSFVIPKYKISDDELYDLLEIAYRILD